MLKNKKYWILMPPFLILAIVLMIFLPENYRSYSFLVIILFWLVYYFCGYNEKKKLPKIDGVQLPLNLLYLSKEGSGVERLNVQCPTFV